jgi:large-conductance mechanosensitive channel
MSKTPKHPSGYVATFVATGEGMKVAHGKRHHHHATGNALLDPADDMVREQFGGFLKFLRDHAVVGVAIGFIVGLQAQTLIKQLVASFVTPLLTLIVGPNLEHRQWVVDSRTHVVFAWGEFLYTLSDFLVVLLFIYLVVKFFQLDKLDKK